MHVCVCVCLQVFYHHGVVQQLKRLYNQTLRPWLVQDDAIPEASTKATKKEKV